MHIDNTEIGPHYLLM